ncbi:MAG: hypothetical protein ABRQ30_02350 [Smithellaceae bacterium]
MKRKLIAFLVSFALITSAVPVMAGEIDEADIIADALVVRPVSFAAMLAGSVIFVIALPFSIPSGSVETVGQQIVVAPAKYTFIRPMGDFDYNP